MDGKQIGTIIKGVGGLYFVKMDDGEVVTCRARGILRKQKVTPLVGDRAEVSGFLPADNSRSSDSFQGSAPGGRSAGTGGSESSVGVGGLESGVGGDFALDAILPRKNALKRPSVANVDQALIVAAAASPDPAPRLLDKMLVAAEYHGIEPVLCVNKTDLAPAAELAEIYRAYPVLCVSAASGEGVEALRERLRGRTTVFTGNSGVGKSSLLNCLNPHFLARDAALETGEVSKIGRGRHTTRHAELMELDSGGFVIDTPGFGSYELEEIKSGELKDYFPEFCSFEGQCRFRGCAHTGEPDCAVADAVSDGDISPERLESYRTLYAALKDKEKW